MRLSLLLTGLCLAAVAHSTPVRLPMQISAEVKAYCRLFVADAEVRPDGQVGQVRELCNTPSGYVVEAQFSNLSAGVVRAGNEEQALGDEGSVRFTSNQARSLVRQWSIEKAERQNPDQPIQVRFSITPL